MASLELIHSGEESLGLPHVVFVHGLGGDIRRTWMHDHADPASLWPLWVGEDLRCATWLLGYDAALSGWLDEAMPLTQQGSAVLDLLAGEPTLRNARLVCVGHSLGGLVIKTALIQAATLGVARYDFFPRQLRGVVFVATPHFGAHLASLASGLKHMLRTNEQVGDMRVHDPHLATLNTQFRALHKQLGFAVRSYCETRGVTFPRRFFGIRPTPAIRVVDGADPHVDGDSGIYLPEDHFSICKPASRQEQIHKSLLSFLQSVAQSDASPFRYDTDRRPDLDAISETANSLSVTIHGCEFRVVAGRIEQHAPSETSVIVLPCNEYFDDECADDSRSSLGAYVSARFPGQAKEFMAFVRDQCRVRFGSGKPRKKTEVHSAPSFGAGRCLLLESPLGTATRVALLSTTTQRAGEGLSSKLSDIFLGIEDLATALADTRQDHLIMPVLGTGHGGLHPTAGLSGLLFALSEASRRGAAKWRRVTVVVYQKDSRSPLQIDPWVARYALALIGTEWRR